MKIDGMKWLAAVKQAYEDGKCNNWKPASGEVCAIATARYIRDALQAELAAGLKADPKADVAKLVKTSFSELIGSIQTEKLQGFASNASAASSAAGFKAEATGAAKLIAD